MKNNKSLCGHNMKLSARHIIAGDDELMTIDEAILQAKQIDDKSFIKWLEKAAQVATELSVNEQNKARALIEEDDTKNQNLVNEMTTQIQQNTKDVGHLGVQVQKNIDKSLENTSVSDFNSSILESLNIPSVSAQEKAMTSTAEKILPVLTQVFANTVAKGFYKEASLIDEVIVSLQSMLQRAKESGQDTSAHLKQMVRLIGEFGDEPNPEEVPIPVKALSMRTIVKEAAFKAQPSLTTIQDIEKLATVLRERPETLPIAEEMSKTARFAREQLYKVFETIQKYIRRSAQHLDSATRLIFDSWFNNDADKAIQAKALISTFGTNDRIKLKQAFSVLLKVLPANEKEALKNIIS